MYNANLHHVLKIIIVSVKHTKPARSVMYTVTPGGVHNNAHMCTVRGCTFFLYIIKLTLCCNELVWNGISLYERRHRFQFARNSCDKINNHLKCDI